MHVLLLKYSCCCRFVTDIWLVALVCRSRSESYWTAVVGEFDITKTDPEEQVMKVNRIITHPKVGINGHVFPSYTPSHSTSNILNSNILPWPFSIPTFYLDTSQFQHSTLYTSQFQHSPLTILNSKSKKMTLVALCAHLFHSDILIHLLILMIAWLVGWLMEFINLFFCQLINSFIH